MPEVFIEVESCKFADIVRHWVRERLVHEVLVARELTCVGKDDFRKWLVLSGRSLPGFWFAAHERAQN